MNREQKAAAVAEIVEELRGAEAVLAVDYRGLSVTQAAELRTRLRDADARFRVVKNTLTARAADEAGTEGLKEILDGPTALAFVRGDAALAAKALSDTARATDILSFKGGLLNGASLTAEDVRAIARLPAREVLHGQLVGVVASPITGLARGLNALVSGLAVALGQIAEQGLVGGGAATEKAAPANAAPGDAAGADAAGEEAAPGDAARAPDPTGAETAEPAPDPQKAAEQPSDDPDAEPHDAPVQPDQAEGEDTNPQEDQ